MERACVAAELEVERQHLDEERVTAAAAIQANRQHLERDLAATTVRADEAQTRTAASLPVVQWATDPDNLPSPGLVTGMVRVIVQPLLSKTKPPTMPVPAVPDFHATSFSADPKNPVTLPPPPL